MNDSENVKKAIIINVVLSAVFLLILFRFGYFQIYLQKQYFEKSEQNRVREIVTKPLRGLIFDRHENVLVENRPAYSVYAIPFLMQHADSLYPLLCSILQIDSVALRNKIDRDYYGLFRPVKLKRHVDFLTLSKIEEYRLQLPGIHYQIEPKRQYPSEIAASHVLGYLGEITKRELDLHENLDYVPGDLIGKAGLERQYEDVLRGRKGMRFVEVDVNGREIRSLTERDAIEVEAGNHLILAIDGDLQLCIEAQMAGKRGGAAVIDVKNGDILALVSKPDYDLRLFAKSIPRPVWRDLIGSPEKPLYDRMLKSLYPPGSIYKLVSALAALEDRIISPQWSVTCPGYLRYGWRNFDCWRAEGHGELDLYHAIEQSCNVYFYKLGQKIGLETWAEYGRKFGIGQPTGIDIHGESAGLLPDLPYFNEKFQDKKLPGSLMLNLAIGQGDLLVTPMQMAVFAMAIANDGEYYRPHILKQIKDARTGEYYPINRELVRIDGISQRSFAIVKSAMSLVVNGANGTGQAAWIPGVQVAGKTGTAENPHGDAHAWFIGFAPVKQPEIAFCVFVENGGAGSAAAAPIAQILLKQYFFNESYPAPAVDSGGHVPANDDSRVNDE